MILASLRSGASFTDSRGWVQHLEKFLSYGFWNAGFMQASHILSLDADFADFCARVHPAFEFQTSNHFLSDFWLNVVFFAVRYSSSPLSKKCHFGHIGGADHNLTIVLQKTIPVTTGKSKERKERISKTSMVTLREIISDGLFETDSRTSLRKLIRKRLCVKLLHKYSMKEERFRVNLGA